MAVRDGRLRARPPRRGALERRRDRGTQGLGATDVVTNFGDGPVRDSSAGRGGRGRRGRLRPVRRGPDGRGHCRRASGSSASTRPNGRVVGIPFYTGKLAWFERLARWSRRAGGEPGRRRSSSAATSTSPRPTTTSGTRSRPTAGRTCPSPSGRPSEPPATGAWSTPTGRAHDERRAVLAGGTTGRACSTRTSGCGSTTCSCHAPVAGAGRRRRDRPRGTQGPAGPVRPRPAVDGPRRAGTAVRPGLGGRARADRKRTR